MEKKNQNVSLPKRSDDSAQSELGFSTDFGREISLTHLVALAIKRDEVYRIAKKEKKNREKERRKKNKGSR